ncbi:MAG: hypothetical protein RJA07_736 [Bacteroidota bacterium]|jgi:hypothetical protein
MKSVLLILISFIFAQSIFAQTTYYVSTLGNDTNNGTSISSTWKTIKKAATTVAAGGTIEILAGTYHEKIIPLVTGLPNNFITIKNHQNDSVIIDGGGINGWGVLTFYGPSYFKIEGIHFAISDSSSAYNWQPAIIVGSISSNIEFKNCTFNHLINKHSTGIALYGNDTTAAGVHDITITNCNFGNSIFSMTQAIGIAGNVHDCSIINNTIHHIANSGIALVGSDSTSKKWIYDYARNISISNNIIHDVYNKTPGNYQQGIVISGARNCMIEKNRIYNCDFGINISGYSNYARTDNIAIRENLIYKNYLQGISIGIYNYTNSTARIRYANIHHNTLYQNNSLKTSAGEIVLFPFDSSSITHNIFYANNQNMIGYSWFYGAGWQNNMMDYNLFCSSFLNPSSIIFNWDGNYTTGFGYYKMVSNQDANSIFADPLFVDENKNDFHLYNTSKAVDAGNTAFIITTNETDFENQSRIFNGKVDIGADENQGEFVRDTISLGINELENEISIYPNPCGDELTVFSNQPRTFGIVNLIEVKNMLGQIVSCNNLKSTEYYQLNTANLNSGIYFLQLTDMDGKTYRKQFIKN